MQTHQRLGINEEQECYATMSCVPGLALGLAALCEIFHQRARNKAAKDSVREFVEAQ